MLNALADDKLRIAFGVRPPDDGTLASQRPHLLRREQASGDDLPPAISCDVRPHYSVVSNLIIDFVDIYRQTRTFAHRGPLALLKSGDEVEDLCR